METDIHLPSPGPGRCEVCGRPAMIHLCEIVDGVRSEHHLCEEHADRPTAGSGTMQSNGFSPAQTDAIRAMMGPGHLDHTIRNAIQMCWMMLPNDQRTVDEVEKQMRRILDRALKDLREDSAAFGLPHSE